MFEVGKYERLGYELFLGYPDIRKKYRSFCWEFEIGFLLGLIDNFRFTDGRAINTVLELGIQDGVTSFYMLKTGCGRANGGGSFELYGIDKGSTDSYGQAVLNEASKEELEHHHLYRGSTSFDIEKILGEKRIDMVFIDAAHSHPYPIIDLIHMIPFLHNESLVLLHDVVNMEPHEWGASFIYDAWKDKKYTSVYFNDKHEILGETALGWIKIPSDKKELYNIIEQVIEVPFRAVRWKFDDIYLGIDESHIKSLRIFMSKYYDNGFSEKICDKLLLNLEEYKRSWMLYFNETKFFFRLFQESKKHSSIINDLEMKLRQLEIYVQGERDTLQAERNALRLSFSYRIGRMLTWFPRKVRRFLR